MASRIFHHLCVVAAASSLALLTAACSGMASSGSETKNLVNSTDSAANHAVIFMGNANNIPGVYKDPDNVERVLTNPQYQFNFKVTRQPTNSTAEAIKSVSAQVAREMLDGPDKDAAGTFLFYFTGHGLETGEMMAQDRPIFFQEIATSIKQARGNKAFKRLIVVVDACFSGNLVDGRGAISNALRDEADGSLALAPGDVGAVGLPQVGIDDKATSRYLEALNKFADSIVRLKDGLYEELILVSSSRKTETSGDTTGGGLGTVAFLNAMTSLASVPGATIKMLADTTVANATGQTPVYRIEPPTLADELLFGASPAAERSLSTDAATGGSVTNSTP